MTPRLSTALALGAITALSTACVEPEAPGDDVEAPPPEEDGGEITPLTGERAGFYGVFEVGKTWPDDVLSVCWMDDVYSDPDPDVKALRDAGRAVVLREWGRVSRMRISSSWGKCSNNPSADIRIGKVTDQPFLGWSKIGTSALEVPAGEPTMLLSFFVWEVAPCDGANRMCNIGGGPEGLDPSVIADFEHVILHEFGHALGLRHEHAHPDETCGYDEALDPEGYDGEPIWAYDASSVMNYCNAGNRLSVGDIRALNTLYPGMVSLFDGNDLANGSSGATSPHRLGPGYYTSAQVPQLATTSSIVVPPGYRARLCTTSACAYFTQTARTLSSTYNDRVVNIAIEPWVIGADLVGYRGTSERFGVGNTSAAAFQVLGDNTMSSVFVPPTRAATVCSSSAGDGTCAGPIVGGGVPTGVKLPTGVNNAVSHIAVTARAVTFTNSGFYGTSSALTAGTYKATTNAPWLVDVRALAISGHQVTACTAISTSPLGGGAGDCRTYTQSVDLVAAGQVVATDDTKKIRYLKVAVPLENQLP